MSAEQTKAVRCKDTNGDGSIDDDKDGNCDSPQPAVTLENLQNLWEAGLELWRRDIYTSPRKIYTTIGAGLIDFSAGDPDLTDYSATLKPYLNAVSYGEAIALIKYIQGEDNPVVSGITYSYRERTTGINLNGDTGDTDTDDPGESAKVWKLGDVLNSTPKISSWIPLNTYDQVYGDSSYKAYLNFSTYKDRGMVFAGGNDGMLHAFKLGQLELKWDGQKATEKARLTGLNLGKEEWAYIPKNALPYLKYMTDPGYCHIFTVDLTPYVFDASIGDLGSGDISNSSKPNDGSTWRTIIIGGMRFGGACKPKDVSCSTNTPNSVCAPVEVDGSSVGYSSYFALDVTNQNSPVLLWEFSDPNLGFATTGPSVVRIGADRAKNGKWFVVFGSGPTGPIISEDQQFLGKSDQKLRLFIFDLKTGPGVNNSNVIVKNTNIPNAFAGSMLNATHDADLNYQDDVVYIPYVKEDTVAGTWTQGGVVRLLTKEDESPSNWAWSQVIDNIGPVTSAVVRLQHKTKKTLWLYFGTGRYYFEQIANVDDQDGQRRLFGITEPCFENGIFNTTCTLSRTTGQLSSVDVTSEAGVEDDEGWYINLDSSAGAYRAERVITDPLSTTIGLVFFTTYKPYNDVCAFGGKSHIWALKYDTAAAPGALLKGTALLQVSTGSIEQVDLSTAFTEKSKRRTGALEGVPPTSQGLSLMTTPPPVKRVIHMRER
jgi:type IV pilus assembly protein PilY1